MNATDPVVSIGLPVRNGQNFLVAAIKSFLAQSFADFELIICDNASDDRTQAIGEEYARADRRVHYHRLDQNVGAAANFNRVFEMSCGRYFRWAAHDDICASTYLAKCVQMLDQFDDTVVAHCATGGIDASNQVKGVYPAERSFDDDRPHRRFYDIITGRHYCLAVFGLIRRSALEGSGLIGPYVGSDRTLLAELGLKGKIRLAEDCLFFRRDHAGTTMRRWPDEYERLAWFDPDRAGRLSFPTWRRMKEYLAAVRRVDLPPGEKRRCYRQVVRWIGARHHTGARITAKLWEDLRVGVRMGLGGRTRNGDAGGINPG